MPNKIDKLKRFQKDADLAVFEGILDLEEQVALSRDVLLSALGELNSVDFDLVKGEKGEKGEDGITPDQEEIIKEVLGKIPIPANGKDGKDGQSVDLKAVTDEVMKLVKLPENGINGKDGADGKDGSPDTAADIRNKLESLRDEERLDIGAINFLDSKLNELAEKQEELEKASKIKISMSGGDGGSSGGGAVTSVFTRTGAVVATTGDYTAAQVTNAVSTLYTAVVTDLGNQAAAVAMDVAVSPNYIVTLTGNATLTLSNIATAPFVKYTILVKQDGVGSHTLTMPAGVKTVGGAGITLSTAANAEDIISFFSPDGGTTVYAEIGTSFA